MYIDWSKIKKVLAKLNEGIPKHGGIMVSAVGSRSKGPGFDSLSRNVFFATA